jgi:serine/threonine-protein kinase
MLKNNELINRKYRVLEKIGSGGMSNVYLVRDEQTGRNWAMKEAKSEEGDIRQSLVAEANILKQLRHKGLPQIVDIIEEGSRFFIVMEYVRGNSLRKVLDSEGAQKEDKVIEWGIQICSVMSYLHSRTPMIIYRDLKPSNIILKPDGSLMLIDFGTARRYKYNRSEDTINLGTKGYAAPEQYGNLGQTDPRTDVYTLGATLFHLVTGKHPKDTPKEFPMIRNVDSSLSPELEQIIARCCQTNALQRYQSCADVARELILLQEKRDKSRYLYLTGFAVSAVAFVLSTILAGRTGFRNVVFDLLCLVFLGAGAVMGYFFLSGNRLQQGSEKKYASMIDASHTDMGSGIINGEGTASIHLGEGTGLIVEDEVLFLASREIIVP